MVTSGRAANVKHQFWYREVEEYRGFELQYLDALQVMNQCCNWARND